MGELCLAWSWSILGPISPRVNIPRCGAGNHLLGNEFCFAIDFINQLYREGWANKRQSNNREIINLRFHDFGQKILHGMNKLWPPYNNEYHIAATKNQFSFWPIFINISDYLVPWCGKRLYLRECTQVTASRSFLWIFDSQPGCSRRATYWFAQDRARVTSGGPKIHFRRPRCERRGAEIHPGKLASWENKKNLERLPLVWLRWGTIYNILFVFSIMNKNI